MGSMRRQLCGEKPVKTALDRFLQLAILPAAQSSKGGEVAECRRNANGRRPSLRWDGGNAMRKLLALTAGLLSFSLVTPATAQKQLTVQGARSMVGSVTPHPIQMKVVDTSK